MLFENEKLKRRGRINNNNNTNKKKTTLISFQHEIDENKHSLETRAAAAARINF